MRLKSVFYEIALSERKFCTKFSVIILKSCTMVRNYLTRYGDRYAVYGVDGQYNSEREASSTKFSSLDEVTSAPAGRGSSSCCYDNGAVGAVGDLWCLAGCSGLPHGHMDTWSSSRDSKDLAELFSRIGLGKYTDIFEQQEVSEYHIISCFRFMCCSCDCCVWQLM